MHWTRGVLTLTVFSVLLSCSPDRKPPTETELRATAAAMAKEFIIADTHIDVPYRLREKMEDISGRTESGDFDYPRARDGGLDLAFMSIYVPSSYEADGGSHALADSLISMVEGFWKKWPDKFAPGYSVATSRASMKSGLISLPLGMENGSPLEGSLENLRYFYNRGIRYITLAHSKSNHLSDSSYDKNRKWNGLSPFGVAVVNEMNRLGIMVDISHVSDSAFYQVLRHSAAPVIASHSSCRAFTPGWERNLSDDMIRALARNGGVVQINFGSAFLAADLRKKWETGWAEINKHLDEHKLNLDDPEAKRFIAAYREAHSIGYADISDVMKHIEHVVALVGPNHVGFGSDFDGVGDSLPTGLKDVSMYPNLVYEMLSRGYSEEIIRNICGENLLRVWSQVEATAERLQKDESQR